MGRCSRENPVSLSLCMHVVLLGVCIGLCMHVMLFLQLFSCLPQSTSGSATSGSFAMALATALTAEIANTPSLSAIVDEIRAVSVVGTATVDEITTTTTTTPSTSKAASDHVVSSVFFSCVLGVLVFLS